MTEIDQRVLDAVRAFPGLRTAAVAMKAQMNLTTCRKALEDLEHRKQVQRRLEGQTRPRSVRWYVREA